MIDKFYQPGQRQLQEAFGSVQLADRLNKLIIHESLTEEEQTFIRAQDMVFLSTIDETGQPTVSYKGGNPGFITVIDDRTLALPGYDGNGMFLTAGNIASNNKVGLLFVNFEQPNRLRVHGTAEIVLDDPLLTTYPEAQYLIKITVTAIFMNCNRYVHPHKKLQTSEYVPQHDCVTPEPEWKSMKYFQDVIPPKK